MKRYLNRDNQDIQDEERDVLAIIEVFVPGPPHARRAARGAGARADLAGWLRIHPVHPAILLIRFSGRSSEFLRLFAAPHMRAFILSILNIPVNQSFSWHQWIPQNPRSAMVFPPG
jgi:hypothetical protein